MAILQIHLHGDVEVSIIGYDVSGKIVILKGLGGRKAFTISKNPDVRGVVSLSLDYILDCLNRHVVVNLATSQKVAFLYSLAEELVVVHVIGQLKLSIVGTQVALDSLVVVGFVQKEEGFCIR